LIEKLTAIELCAGGGGQALGLELAGFEHLALIDNDEWACETLRKNRPEWNVILGDLKHFSAKEYTGVDLLAGGVPCPPFSKAGLQLGANDERNLFPEALRLVSECQPKAVMLENVRGLLDPLFKEYRFWIEQEVEKLGYRGSWKLLQASNYGVSQLRPRALFVALQEEYADNFVWPDPLPGPPPTVGETLFEEMSRNGWQKADEWKVMANQIAPTLVGGSKKHGGPDLGPTRAKLAWAKLSVNAHKIANDPPALDFEGIPHLTVKMAALLQGFPKDWEFYGRKTHAYRQVGNAFPPPVAAAVGRAIAAAISFQTVSPEAGAVELVKA
jgi:DNA (cytosine-5)-methyltransferase 1